VVLTLARYQTGGWHWSNGHQARHGLKFTSPYAASSTASIVKTSAAESRMKPAGEWNTIEVTARGKVLSVWLNGMETCAYDQCSVPKGFFALDGEGYPIEFRNLQYKRLE
jgi:hypothetical protein